MGRVRRNDSPTQKESEIIENQMHDYIENGKTNNFSSVNVHTKYDIPYLIDKEINISGVGRVSTNALDSIAKYAGQANLPLKEGLGLAAFETKMGATPVYNFLEDKFEYNRALGNSSYFRNFGLIPAQYLVRDFEYDKGGYNKNQPYNRSLPPLLHAFLYYKSGKYNSKLPGHSSKVKVEGDLVLKDQDIKDWLIQSGDSIYRANLPVKKSGGKFNYLNFFK